MTFLQSDLKINVCRHFRIAYVTYLQNSKPIAIIDMEYSLCLIREFKKDVSVSPQHLIFGVSDRP
jgi:hypothetical protein